jgi:hypothetical protein
MLGLDLAIRGICNRYVAVAFAPGDMQMSWSVRTAGTNYKHVH